MPVRPVFPYPDLHLSRIATRYDSVWSENGRRGDMGMSVEDLDFNDFGNVLRAISRVDAWEWDAGFSQGSIQNVAQKAETTEAEGRFSHIDTDGVLYVRLPDLSETQGCMIALLEQPFDPQYQKETAFLQKVGEAAGRLVPDSEVEYVTPETTAINILKMSVPVRYQIEKIEAAAYTASIVSMDVEELYQNIRNAV